MEMSLSSYIVGLRTRKLFLLFERLVYILAPVVEIGSDLGVFCSVFTTFTIIARAPRGAVRCKMSRLKVLLSIENSLSVSY